MIYSIVPPELLCAASENKTKVRTVCHNGRLLEGEEIDGFFIVSRIISSDPKDYLDGKTAPGTKIRLK